MLPPNISNLDLLRLEESEKENQVSVTSRRFINSSETIYEYKSLGDQNIARSITFFVRNYCFLSRMMGDLEIKLRGSELFCRFPTRKFRKLGM